MKVVILIPQYPFGKSQIYLNGSAVSVAARLVAIGHDVEVIDLNINSLEEANQSLAQADLIGITLTGSANIPNAIDLVKEIRSINSASPIVLGGAVVEKLSEKQFRRIFPTEIQIRNNQDLARVLGCNAQEIPQEASFVPVYKSIGDEKMRMYLENEMVLVLSQGCKNNCKFCAAKKTQREKFRDLKVFEEDLKYLAEAAKKQGLEAVKLYASNLDFFQNPEILQDYLEVLANIQKEVGIKIRVRALSCIDSFLKASKVKNIKNLLRQAGVWCLAFGSDGFDESVWESQGKRQNTAEGLIGCLEVCRNFGIQSEILMVLGFPEDTHRSLLKAVRASIKLAVKYGSKIRPYLAKPLVPGNEGWSKLVNRVEEIMTNPQLFYNLDFCAIGSRLTHPRSFHRWLCNTAYLTIIFLLTPVGKNTTFPLLPQGERRVYGKVAKLVNRLMPFDR